MHKIDLTTNIYVSLVKSKNYIKFDFIRLIILLILFALVTTNVYSDNKKSPKALNPGHKDAKIFPDEYGELDEVPIPKSTKDEHVLKTLEKSRQKYLQALIMIERKDTTTAAKYFEEAINILNPLVSYPGIEKNDDFTELAQSIIEDYESFITNIDNLSENSSLFIFRDKLFQEIEHEMAGKSPQTTKTILTQPIQLKNDTNKAVTQKKADSSLTIPLDSNEHVNKMIEFLTQNKIGKKYIKNCIERSTRWLPTLKKILNEEQMPEELIYLAMTESALNPVVISRAKAVGLWQFIRSTGELYGLNVNSSVWLDERNNPEKATRAAARHLKDLYNELGDWYLAFAAYNYGLHGVRKSLAKCKYEKPNYWQVREFLPKETRSYIPMFIATAKVFMNPERYGINTKEFSFLEEYKYETYTVKEPISTKALAKCANITIEKFREYNPELISTTTPPDIPEYTVRIPEGSKSTFVASLATLSPEEKRPWITHTVGNRETVNSIALKYGISSDELLSANTNLNGKKKLKKGTLLHIPVESMVQDNLASKKSQPDSGDSDDDNTEEINPNIRFINHDVKKGETLYGISQRYNVRIADIRGWNNIAGETEDIAAGTSLRVGVSPKIAAQNQQPAIRKITNPVVVKHIVRQGETLAQIADDYKVSIDGLRKWNRIENNIKKGQTLKIVTTEIKPRSSFASKAQSSSPTLSSSAQDHAIAQNSEPVKKQKKEEIIVPVTKRHKISYKVKRGDKLGIIAAKYGVTESEIKQWNRKTVSGSKILSGTNLTIFVDQPQKGSSASSSKKVNKLTKYYVVRKGDTLKEIADKFGVPVKIIKQKNHNITDSKLQKGQKIKIQ